MTDDKLSQIIPTDLDAVLGSAAAPLALTDAIFPATSPISAMRRNAVPAAESIDAERVGLSSKADRYMHSADFTVTQAD